MTRQRIVSIAVVSTLAIVVGLGFLAVWSLKTLLYPPAPPMPAEVAATMPEILLRLESVLKTKAPHILETLQPGLSAEAISKLENQFAIKLPDDIKQLYHWRNGAHSTTNALEQFFPLYRFVPLDEALTERDVCARQLDSATFVQRAASSVFAGHHYSWLCIFADGSGNGYFYDPKRKPEQGSIFYNYMDEADYVFFPSMKNVMAGVARCYEKEAFKVKEGQPAFELEENYEAAEQIWSEFGARRQ